VDFVPSSLALPAAAAVILLVLIAALIALWRERRKLHQLVQQRAGDDDRIREQVHELNQPLTAILSNAQAAQRFLASEAPDVQEVREILEDIVLDDKRAAGIVRSIGGILRETKVLVPAHDRGNEGGENPGVHKERTQ
jgi:signal transduction histidine kinase